MAIPAIGTAQSLFVNSTGLEKPVALAAQGRRKEAVASTSPSQPSPRVRKRAARLRTSVQKTMAPVIVGAVDRVRS